MKEKIIARGAEAIISLSGNKLTKERITKSYRYPALDKQLRKRRTKSEAKLLEKSSKLISSPKVISSSIETYKIQMEHIKGKRLSEHLDKFPKAEQTKVSRQIGRSLAILHDEGIIHGDLTTSNLILSDKNKKVYFIDFGLGFHSNRSEDKAVDLHLISQALEAKHSKNAKTLFKKILEGYKKSKNYSSVLTRLQKVEKRGRYKAQY